MSLHLTISEKIFPKIVERKDDFLKIFSDEMARRGFKVKISRESGFDLIYSDIFGEAKIYVQSEDSYLRCGYKLGISFLLFAIIIILPILELYLIIASAALIILWTIRILTLKGALNEAFQNAYQILIMSESQSN